MTARETPNGYYLSTKDWMAKTGVSIEGAQYIEFEFGTAGPRPFVAMIPGGRIWGSAGCVITPDNRILWDVSREWSNTPEDHSIFTHAQLPKVVETAETVAVLSKIGSQNYYHWTFDVLPRIHLLRQSGVVIDKYVVGSNLAPFQYETLAMLGVPKDRLIESDEQFHWKAKTLVVPSLPLEAKWACDFLRREFQSYLCTATTDERKRIYISRENCVGRTVVNQTAVLKFLDPYGFEVVMPETLTVAEQIHLFSSADVIVGPHGSGFTNVMFAKPQTVIIEFMSPNFFITSTELLCKYTNLAYYRLIGTGSRPPKYVGSEWYWCGLDNIEVSTEKLAQIFKSAGIHPCHPC